MYFAEFPLGIVWCFSHDYSGAMGLWEEDYRGKMPFLITSYHVNIVSTWLITCSPGWGSVCHVSPLQSYSFFLLSMLYSLKVRMHSPHLKRVALDPPSLRTKYQHKLFGIFLHGIFVCSPPFVYSIIFKRKESCMLYILCPCLKNLKFILTQKKKTLIGSQTTGPRKYRYMLMWGTRIRAWVTTWRNNFQKQNRDQKIK